MDVEATSSTAVGLSCSTTETLNVSEPTLPALSVAVQVTRVLPSEKKEPGDGEHDGTIGPSTMSKAEPTEKNSCEIPVSVSASTVMSAVAVTTGGVVSVIVTS